MKEFSKRRAVHIFMLLLVVFVATAFVACKNTNGDKNDKKIGLSIEYTEKTWFEGDVFEVPGYKTEVEGASVTVSYTIDGGSEILALVGSSVDIYAGDYVFTYKATMTGYAAEEKTISFTAEERGEDSNQTVSIDGFTGPVYESAVFAMDDFTVPTGHVSEGSQLKITMTDPQGVRKEVTGGQNITVEHSGDYVFTYEAVHSNSSYKNKKINLTVRSTYRGLVGDFENFALTSDVVERGYVSIQSEIKHDGENALRLRTSGDDKFPWNRPQVEQVNYSTTSKFGKVADDANTVSFWIYPTTDDVLLLSLGFCHPDNWEKWHKDREFKNSALLIGSLEPNKWHYVSLPLPEQFTPTVFSYGLTHFGVYVLKDKNYNTYYNYRDLLEIGGDRIWKDDNGTEHENVKDYWQKGPVGEVVTYIDSVCFTNDPDWNCDKAFKKVAPTVTMQHQTYVVDYLAQTDANIRVTYTVNDDATVYTKDKENKDITKGSQIVLEEAGTYKFKFEVLDRGDGHVIYSTVQEFVIQAVSNEISIPEYAGTSLTENRDTLSTFIVPEGQAKEPTATLEIELTDPKNVVSSVHAGDEIELGSEGDYVFAYIAKKDGVELGRIELTVKSSYKGLIAGGFDNNFVVTDVINQSYVNKSNEQAHDGTTSLKFKTRLLPDPVTDANNGYPWNRPRLEQWNGTEIRVDANANTVSFWVYANDPYADGKTESHRLLLNLGFEADNYHHALYIGRVPAKQWSYVSLPLPNEIKSNMSGRLIQLGFYVLADSVEYDNYYNYQSEKNLTNERNKPYLGPDKEVTVYMDTLCFTNDPDWNCDKALMPVMPAEVDLYSTFGVDYKAQSGANIKVSYTVGGGTPVETDKDGEPLTKGSQIVIEQIGKYVFKFEVLSKDGQSVVHTMTREFTVKERSISIAGYENKPYIGYKAFGTATFGAFTVPAGTASVSGATVSITMKAPNASAEEAVIAEQEITFSVAGDYVFTYTATNDDSVVGKDTLTIHAYNGLVADFENFTLNPEMSSYKDWTDASSEQAYNSAKSLKFTTKTKAEGGWPQNRPRLEQFGGTMLYAYQQAKYVSFRIYPTTSHRLYLNLGFGDHYQGYALKIGDLAVGDWNYVSLRLPDDITPDILAIHLQHFGVYVLNDDNTYDQYYNDLDETKLFGFDNGPDESVTVYVDDLCFTVEEYAASAT